jgi:thioredoxin-dependent adenylylsulfate APS reductase
MRAVENSPERVAALNRDFQNKTPTELLAWAVEEFKDRIALCSAFGPESIVILHMLIELGVAVRVFTIDTGRLPSETHSLIQRCQDRFKMPIDVYGPDSEEVQQMVRKHGINLFYNSVELRELCCKVRKVHPMTRALESLDAWISGLRRDQGDERKTIQKLEFDSVHQERLKLNPLANWSEAQVWNYISCVNLPYNPLHNRGYRSVGCAPCSRATNPGEDARAGRWWWERSSNKECGIHTVSEPDDL